METCIVCETPTRTCCEQCRLPCCSTQCQRVKSSICSIASKIHAELIGVGETLDDFDANDAKKQRKEFAASDVPKLIETMISSPRADPNFVQAYIMHTFHWIKIIYLCEASDIIYKFCLDRGILDEVFKMFMKLSVKRRAMAMLISVKQKIVLHFLSKNPKNPFIIEAAVRSGRVDLLKWLLEDGRFSPKSIDLRKKYNTEDAIVSPVVYAIRTENNDMMSLLFNDKRVDYKVVGDIIFNELVKSKKMRKWISLILANKRGLYNIEDTQDGLYTALEKNDVMMVRVLLHYGAEFDGGEFLIDPIIAKNYKEMFKMLLEIGYIEPDGVDDDLLQHTRAGERLYMTKLLLQYGADPTINNMEVIRDALVFDQPKFVQLCLQTPQVKKKLGIKHIVFKQS